MTPGTRADVERIAAKLTDKQRAMMTRENGRYQDDWSDVAALMNLELIGTVDLPLGTAVRAYLQEQGK